jgi:class 3 adenylate cyclase
MPVCALCGQDNPARARFCMSCASPLPSEEPAPRGARKTVTVVFCDIEASTRLTERLEPESARDVLARFFRQMRAALERHGGTVEKYIGDAVMAVFGAPVLHEIRVPRRTCGTSDARGLEALNVELDVQSASGCSRGSA